MDSNNPIKYSDLVQPDTAITDLIAQLKELSEQYGKSIKDVKDQASQLANSLRGASGATDEGREAIKKASTEADRLAQAEKKLQQARAANRQEIAKLNRVAKEKNTLTKLIEKRNKSAEGSYNRLSAQYSLNKIRLNAMSKAMREGTAEGRRLEEETRKIYEEMKRLQAATGKMQLNVGNYPQMFGTALSQFGGIGGQLSGLVTAGSTAAASLAGVGIAAAGVAKVVEDSTSVTMEYNHAVSVLSAITGETRDSLAKLTNQARELGSSTKYTATEVVGLQTELAKLGYTQDEIFNMTQGVLSFASATGSGLSEAASLAGAALRIFNADSTHTTEYVDKMSAATTNSALDFSYLENALSTVGPVAASFGFKIEDVLSLLGQLANAGFDASSAATATRNILLNLADANGKLALALGKPVTNLDDLVDGLVSLKDSGIDLGEALELTDKRSVAAFSKFLDNAADTRELRDALNEASGAAQEMARVMSDDLTGDVAALGSAYDDLMITLGGGQSVWRGLVQWLTDAVTAFNKFVKKVQDAYAEVEAYIDLLIGIAKIRLGTGGGIQKIAEALVNIRGGRKKKEEEKPKPKPKTEEEEEDKPDKPKTHKPPKTQKEIDAERRKAEAEKRKKEAEERREKQEAEKEERRKEQSYKNNIALVRKYEDLQLEEEKDTYVKRQKEIKYQYEREEQDLIHKLATDKTLTNEGQQAIAKSIIQLRKNQAEELKQLELENQVNELQVLRDTIKMRISAAREGSDEELSLRKQLLETEMQIELRQNARKPASERQSTADITAKYQADAKKIADDYIKAQMAIFDEQQKLASTEYELLRNSEGRKTRFRLQAEKERIQKVLEMNKQAGTKLTDLQKQQLEAQMRLIDKQIKESATEERTADIYGMLGLNLDDKQKAGINEAYQYAMGQLNDFMALRTQEAQAAVDASNKEVSAAQSRLDAEMQARANGYASNVELAQKELADAKENQRKAIEQQKKMQRQQQAIQAVQEANNLVLASSRIWGDLGFPWAIPAIAVMWGSFAAAKIKAMQMTKKQEYRDGTVELLQGGSHASGNDIDLGTKPDGTQRRAEGGEFFAVINKRNSRKYRSIIPDVINSFNDGTFAAKYMNDTPNGAINVNVNNGNDIGELTDNVREIRKQGEARQYNDANGNVIIEYKNRKRIIKK